MKNLRSHIQNKGVEQNDEGVTEIAKKIMSAYEGKSGAGIWLQILSEAEKSKRAGTLSNAEIDEFYRQFEPMLSGEQKQQLRLVVERLKGL